MKKFRAVSINCADEDDVLTIGAGDDENNPENFFIIGRFDEDELPVDECIGFQSDTTDYEIADAIESVTLTIGELDIVLNEKAASMAGFGQYIAEIPESTDLVQLKKYLQDIFAGSNVIVKLF